MSNELRVVSSTLVSFAAVGDVNIDAGDTDDGWNAFLDKVGQALNPLDLEFRNRRQHQNILPGKNQPISLIQDAHDALIASLTERRMVLPNLPLTTRLLKLPTSKLW